MLRRMIRSVPISPLRLSRPTLSTSAYSRLVPTINRQGTRTHYLLPQQPTPPHRSFPSDIYPRPSLSASFHTTPRNEGSPLIPILATLFKASTGFEVARTAGRVALTFVPLLWFKNRRTQKIMHFAAIHGVPGTEEEKAQQLKRIKYRTRLVQLLLLVPFTLFWSTIIASLERTPLTGRWRMILLSPEEEDEIARQLAGPGWYNSVGEILTAEGSPKIIPPTDWRYQWVQNILRQLESSIPVLSREPELCPNWIEGSSDHKPLPPPADYPLRPRPRASEYLRWFCEKLTKSQTNPPPLSVIPGPPYSLLVIEKPESSNAFSYGFGPDGGSGIVVYSGFLDDILSRIPMDYIPPPPPAEKSLWTKLFGGLFTGTSSPTHPTPTQEQETELAILLAHEMAHLILSHHLESLSSVTVIVPGTLSIASDVIRVLLFPITMLFGPFVNDAVAQLGKVGSGELAKMSEFCTSVKQEIEADVVSARLLAHAGYDARDAVKFWESRSGTEAECARHAKSERGEHPITVARSIMGDSHPVSETRVNSLRSELARWENERLKATSQPSSTSENLSRSDSES